MKTRGVPKLIQNTLVIETDKRYMYPLNGQGIGGLQSLKPVKAYQEFLHSWKHFSQPERIHWSGFLQIKTAPVGPWKSAVGDFTQSIE